MKKMPHISAILLVVLGIASIWGGQFYLGLFCFIVAGVSDAGVMREKHE